MLALHIGATVATVWLACGHIAYRASLGGRPPPFFLGFVLAVMALAIWGIWA